MSRKAEQTPELIDVSCIDDDGTRMRRQINDQTVERLVVSMAEIGLKTPIVVRHFPNRPSEAQGTADSMVLVVGGHRLAAARRLGWAKIECFVLGEDADDREVRLWEIAENLDRAELTQLERKEHIAEWVRLTNEKRKLAQVAPVSKKGGRGNEGGANAASRELGVERTEVQRAVKIAALTPEAKEEARSLHLDDNQEALLRAARQPTAEQQVAALRRQQEDAEKVKRDRETNKIISLTAAEEYAEWLMGNIGLNELPTLIDWLGGTNPKDVIAALRRMTKDPGPAGHFTSGVRGYA